MSAARLPREMVRKILDSNARKIDDEIREIRGRKEASTILGSWGDSGEVCGIIGEELDALRAYDSRNNGEWPFSQQFTVQLQRAIKLWIREKYARWITFTETHDDNNAYWKLVF